jgi:hypothetical protein
MLEVGALFSGGVFIAICALWPPALDMGNDVPTVYRDNRPKFAMPCQAFWIGWFISMMLEAAAGMVYVLTWAVPFSGKMGTALFEATIALYFFNMTLAHVWRTLFFKRAVKGDSVWSIVGVIVAALLLLSAIPVIVMFALQIPNNLIYIASLVLFSVYTLWLIYVLAVNAKWVAIVRRVGLSKIA